MCIRDSPSPSTDDGADTSDEEPIFVGEETESSDTDDTDDTQNPATGGHDATLQIAALLGLCAVGAACLLKKQRTL